MSRTPIRARVPGRPVSGPWSALSAARTASSLDRSGRCPDPIVVRGRLSPALRGGRGEPGLLNGRLEKFDRIAGGVLDQDLLAADTGDDVVAEMCALRAEPAGQFLEVGDLEAEPVPAPWHGERAVGHRLAAPGSAARCAEHEPEI